MNKKKKINWRFSKFEYNLIEEYLEEMALKGWMIDEIDNKKAIFIQTEPRKLKFCIDITPYGNENTEIFKNNKNHCEKLGWHFILVHQQMGFYYAEKYENTYAVYTDLEIEQQLAIDNIWKKELLKSLFSFIYIVLITLFIFKITRRVSTYIIFTDWTLLILIPFSYIVLVSNFTSKFLWYFKVKSNKGLKIKQKSLKNVKLKNKFLDIMDKFVFILAIVILISNFFPRGVSHNLNKNLFVALIVGFMLGSVFLYLKFEDKFNRKRKIVFTISFFIGITILFYIAAELLLNNDIENPNNIQTISMKYPVIEISDFVDIDEIHDNYFNISYSPFVPVNYRYHEFYREIGIGVYNSYRVETEYYKCINEKIADIIYDGIIEDYKKETKLRFKINDISASYWNSNKATIVSTDILSKDILLLRKGKEVIKVEISEDLANIHDEEFREILFKKFMNYI